jgi:transcriptional regulator GlxA family with amidase domain
MSQEKHIVIAVYAGVSILDLSGPLAAFRVATEFGEAGKQGIRYKCTVVSAQGGLIDTADGVPLFTQALETVRETRIDTLVIPGAFHVDDVTRDAALIDWVARRAPDCRRVCSVCVGSFLLAEAGVLEGRRAATHWMYAPMLAQRHPGVQVEPDAIFVRDGRVWTSAGVTTGIDLALALIEEDCGRDVALGVARMLVVYLKRAGGQSQYSALLTAQGESYADSFAGLDRWIAGNLAQDLRVETLAERANMSLRNFSRAYASKRGQTPAKAVEAIRMDAARRRLEETDERIEAIAEKCGYGGEEQLRAAFVRVLKLSPREYRKRFATSRRQGQDGTGAAR